MILVDTSIWIDHLRSGDADLVAALDRCAVLTHPLVIGELALGNLRNRAAILGALSDLPKARQASDDEVMHFIERHVLFGQGIGCVDAHLLASVCLTPGTRLWTRDKRLRAVADRLGLSTEQVH